MPEVVTAHRVRCSPSPGPLLLAIIHITTAGLQRVPALLVNLKPKEYPVSKFSYQVLQECVYPYTGSDDADVILGASFGEDVSLTRVGDHILASHVDPIISAVGNIGWLATHISCNDIATAGIPPRWLLALVLVPGKEDTGLLKDIMADIQRACRDLNVSLVGGHTEYSPGITRPLVAITALGTTRDQEPISTGGARPGDRILVTKGIALEGTSILAHDFGDQARQFGLSGEDLQSARNLMEEVSVVQDALTLAEHGASAMHDVTDGGILENLLEMAHASEAGIEVDRAQLPIPDIVKRFARAFDFDPLAMISSGTLTAAVPASRAQSALAALHAKGIRAVEIGQVVEGRGVSIQDGDEKIHHTELQAEKDELARLWELHKN